MMLRLLLFVLCFVTTIGTAQNVGIGTSTPGAKFTVNGAWASLPSTVAAAAAPTVPVNVTHLIISALAGAQANALVAPATAQEGQVLTILNQDNNPATFVATTIPATNGTGTFVYLSGAWRPIGGGATTAWSLTGNAGTTPATNFVGTTDAQDMVVRTNNTERMRVLQSNGNVGIGLANPESRLNVNGNISLEDGTGGSQPARVIGFPAAVNGNHGNLIIQAKSVPFDGISQYRGGELILAGGDYNKANTWGVGDGGGLRFRAGANTWGGYANDGPPIIFETGGNAPATYNERMRIDGAGNVGIGTTAPTGALHVVVPGANGGSSARFRNDCTPSIFDYTGLYLNGLTGCQNYNFKSGPVDIDLFINRPLGRNMHFRMDNQAAQMLLDPNGNLGIGTAGPAFRLDVQQNVNGTPVAQIWNSGNTNTAHGLLIRFSRSGGAGPGADAILFQRQDQTTIGAVRQNGGGGVSYVTTSDARLKTILNSNAVGLDALMRIPLYQYHYNEDPATVVRNGFLAQDVYKVFPQSVTPPSDPNADPSVSPWMVDYGSLTPMLMKAIQEQQAMILALQHTNSQYEARFTAQEQQSAQLQAQLERLQQAVHRLEAVQSSASR
jgi:Chaperone of endosialidase